MANEGDSLNGEKRLLMTERLGPTYFRFELGSYIYVYVHAEG